MDGASGESHVEMLQWWKDSSLELRWSHLAMDWSSRNGHVEVLQWWKDSSLELKWSGFAMDRASEEGHVEILQWWKESGLLAKRASSPEGRTSSSCESTNNRNERASANGLELLWSYYAMDGASLCGHVEVLQWWKDSGLE